ncbi:FKBP-type 22 kDa peptidyl-prolyl cis-trans isomerase [Muribaculaceae bacterium]|jgi:hypothetical protein|nr:FKBP-type 22 kDa peptidyl-prolyl cis-trans isomerase [Muribaculaceae bacterium]
MRYIIGIIAILAVALGTSSCDNDEKTTWEEYAQWRESNEAWLKEQQALKNPDGTPYYKVIVPDWNPGSFVLIHYFNDRSETEGNLSPLYTSTIDTRYTLYLYNDTRVDSSAYNTDPAPGIFRTRLNNTVQGWAMALTDMRCGDTAQVVLPYGVAYGSQNLGDIPPYSNLRFNIRLVDIPYYEKPPYGK